MRWSGVGLMAVCVAACGGPRAAPPRVAATLDARDAVAGPQLEQRALVSETGFHVGTFAEPAEPFSETWLESGEGDERKPLEIWINADACPDPLRVATDPDLAPYYAYIERALHDDSVGQLALLQIQPSFSPARSLSVRRRPGGAYVIRSVELTTNVWSQMMEEMRALQGPSVSLGAECLEDGLARVTTSRIVRERKIDGATARLIRELWSSVTARAQVVEEINTMTGEGDGTHYEIRLGKRGSVVRSPTEGSILGDVVSAAEHLETFVQGASSDDKAVLEMARDLMQSALERTRNR